MNLLGWRIERRNRGPQTVADALRQLLRQRLPSDHVGGMVVVYILPENELPTADADPEDDGRRDDPGGGSIFCTLPDTNVKRLRQSVKVAMDELADMEGGPPMGFLKGRG